MSPNPKTSAPGKENSAVPTIETYDQFDQMLNDYISPNDTVALLMDFDGTLAPIQPDPNDTAMPEKTNKVFKKLCTCSSIFPAIISGRGITDVKSKVGVDGIVYAGCHGLEIQYDDGHRYDHYIPPELKNNFPLMYEELKKLETSKDIWVENKKTAICVHFHEVPEEEQKILSDKACKIIKKYGYLANRAHGAIDVKPPVEWHKGKAAEQILESKFGPNWREKVKVVFAGDDATDEDCMKVLKGKGITFRVSDNPNIDTNATYRLRSPDQVYVMLKWIENRLQ